jgi:GT2 family glycosyltransferase
MSVVRHDAKSLSIIIPTKNRCESLSALIGSLKQTSGLRELRPEVIVGDNDSSDRTWKMLERESSDFPTPFRLIKVTRPGKSSVLNDAIRLASGEVCALVDDDVVVERGWLEALHRYFSTEAYRVAQGVVRLPPREANDPEIRRLFNRFQTIPVCEKPRGVQTVDSLNGSNIAICRSVFDEVGGFDERVGPGMAGTAEDTELAQRILAARIQIGFMEEAIVFHQVERERLTESYFERHHRRQGRGRFIYKQPGLSRILGGWLKARIQLGVHSLTGNERKKYRGKGRVYHYGEMLNAKWQCMTGRVSDNFGPR